MSNNAITIQKITQGNAYLNGKSLLGKVESVDLPDLKFIFEEHKAMGMVAKLDLPTMGVDKLEGKIKFNSLYPDVAVEMSPFGYTQLQVRSSINEHSADGIIRQRSLVTTLSMCPKDWKFGKVEQHKNVDKEIDISVIYIKQMLDGKEIIEFDALANILKIGGKDMLAEYRANI